MKGLNRVARRAILTRLKNDAGVLALVAKAEIHGQTPAAVSWPFIVLGVPQTLPLKATCLDGGEVNTPISGFARSSATVTAEDAASNIGAAIELALDARGETVTVDGQPARITYRLSDIRLFPDGAERDAFHYSALVRARIIAE